MKSLYKILKNCYVKGKQCKVKKCDYEKYINPSDFEQLYIRWEKEGKPTGNNPLYVQIFDGVTNAVKACIGALQSRYHCQFQDYDDKVMDSTVLIMNKLLTMDDTPKNIVNMCYLPVLGVCCGPKARQKEFEDAMLSTGVPTEGGDTFEALIDEDGEVQYINY